MDKKLSDWSAPGEKPRMVGVWKTDYSKGFKDVYQYFDGKEFKGASATAKGAFSARAHKSFCNQSTVRFCGLIHKPKGMK